MFKEAFALHQSLAVAAGDGIFRAAAVDVFSLMLLVASIAEDHPLRA